MTYTRKEILDGFVKGRTYEKEDFIKNPLNKGDYECCRFINCNFQEAELGGVKFQDCEFVSCDLSLAKLAKTSFGKVNFLDCKMLGMRFDDCNKYGLTLSFRNCILNHSCFFRMKLTKTVFKNTQLHEVDFSGSDFSQAIFQECDLARAVFQNTILERADFKTSYNYSIDPAMNRIKKAKFSITGIVGLLDKYDIEIE